MESSQNLRLEQKVKADDFDVVVYTLISMQTLQTRRCAVGSRIKIPDH